MNTSGRIDSLIGDHKLHWRLNHALRGLGRVQGAFFDNTSGAGPLRSLVFCTAYVKDAPRYRRWLDYMEPRYRAFGAEAVFLINDGCEGLDFDPRPTVLRHDELQRAAGSPLNLVWFDQRLGRRSMFCYPGWWRSFTYSLRIARELGFAKIIHIESDAFVPSRRLTEHLGRINRGWTALWSPTYAFPETAIQAICSDAFDRLEQFASAGERFFVESNRAAEYLLPFDKIEHRFRGNRCGQLQRDRLPPSLDFMSQVPLDWPLSPDY